MGNHDFEVDIEALVTAASQLADLQERNRTYDVADYTPNGAMVRDPTVVGALDRFNTAWDQGLNGSFEMSPRPRDAWGRWRGSTGIT